MTDLKFHFDPEKYTVTMKVLVNYKYIGPDKKTKRRVSLHDEQVGRHVWSQCFGATAAIIVPVSWGLFFLYRWH